jgi:hypothetical protein
MIMMMKINFHIYDPVPSLTLSLGCFFERSMVRSGCYRSLSKAEW